MDLNLFAFLFVAILVEYLSDLFTRSWWSLASVVQQASTHALTGILRRRYCVGVCTVGACFAVVLITATRFLPTHMGLHYSRPLIEILGFGGAGYLMLTTTLFGSVVLLSVNAAKELFRAAGAALLVNVLVGYLLSHAIATPFASVGLCAGAAVFAWYVHRAVWVKLAHPDYYFSLA
jgi:hypothetical protein